MTTWPKGKITDLLNRRSIDMKQDMALMVEVGSTMHGISVSDQDDLDLTGVRFEPWFEFVNGPEKKQSMMIRTQPDGARSFVGDIDLNVYTVRKFAGLLAKGNPSILAVMYAPDRWVGRYGWVDWDQLLRYTTSKAAGNAFTGYMRQQIERWTGERGQKNVNRPELVEKYGFDTKYAGHAIRLGLQGAEYLDTGKLTLPMHENQAKTIREVRTGGYSEAEALNMAVDVKNELRVAYEQSPLPDSPNMAGVGKWLAETYKRQYGDGLGYA